MAAQIWTEWTPEKRERFLAELRKLPNVSRACRYSKVSRSQVYKQRDEDADFKAAWDNALDEGVEAMEVVAWQRAKKFSDTLMIFLLKAHNPAKYNLPGRHELTGRDGEPLPAPVIYLPAVTDDDSS